MSEGGLAAASPVNRSPLRPREAVRAFGRTVPDSGALRVTPADAATSLPYRVPHLLMAEPAGPASRPTLEEGSADDQATLRPDRIPPARRQPHDHRTTGAGVDPNVGESGTLGVGVGCRINPFEPIECGYGAPEGATLQLQCFYWRGDPVGPNGNTVWAARHLWLKTLSSPTTHSTRPLPAAESDAHSWYDGTGCL